MPRLTKIVGIVLIMFVCTIGTLIGREEKEKTRYVLPPELEKFLLNESDLPGYKLKYESEWMRPGEERRSDIATAKDIKSGIRQRWINLLGRGEFYCSMWLFDSSQDAMEEGKRYSGSFAEFYYEGSFGDTVVGDMSWVSRGAAIIFVYKNQLVHIGIPGGKKGDRRKLQEIAEKIIKKHKEAVKE